MLIPDSQSIPPGNHKFFFQVCESVCFVNTFYSVSVKGTQSKDSEVSRVWLFAVLWTVGHQAPPSMGFPRQEY